jgi:hypothetical protein
MLLGYERSVAESGGAGNLAIDSVISYTVCLSYGDLDHIGDLPLAGC